MVAEVVPRTGSEVDDGCAIHRKWEFNQVKLANPDLLVVTESSDHSIVIKDGKSAFKTWADGFDASVKILSKYAKRIVILGVQPKSAETVENCISKNLELGSGCYASPASLQFYRQVQSQVARKYGAIYLDPVPWLCSETKCPPVIDGTVVYKDNSHITYGIAKKLGPLFLDGLNKAGWKLP
jgi:hypothetical protein